MPAFTAIGAYVAGTLLGLGATTIAFTVVSSIVAVGAAMITSRILNPTPKGGGGSGGIEDKGVRIQLPPATSNKIPVVYGRAHTNPIIIDAYLSNGNKTMTYIMALSETSNWADAAYTVNDIYWNDLRLVFDGSTNNVVAGKKRVDATWDQPEDFSDDNFKDEIAVGVWRWNPNSQTVEILKGNQLPSTFIPDGKWDASYRMEGMVFAAMKMNYNSEKGFTGMPTMTFDITNSIKNPAKVVYDYMTSVRFGGGIAYDDLDDASFFEWAAYCDELAEWTPIDGGALQSSARYEINGIINPNNDVKQNIDSLLLSSGAWISYDTHQGLWRIIPKRAQPTTITFSDDNIISGINLSSTRLEDLYNVVEAQYYDRHNKDQQAYSRVDLAELNPDLLNYNEPVNLLTLPLEFCNNNIQAERIGNMELEQTRDDLVVTFQTAHWGLQCQAGDVIAINNSVYGWQDPVFPAGKQFRVLTVKEVETDEGALIADITALEYNPQVYDDKNISEFYPRENIGIPITGSNSQLPAPSIAISNINRISGVPYFTINVQAPTDGGPFTSIEVIAAEGDDYAGLGGDASFTGQIVGDIMTVTGLPEYDIGPQLWLNEPALGYSSEIFGLGVEPGTKIIGFLTGNGGNGTYQVAPAQTVGIRAMSSILTNSQFTASISGTTLTVTSVAFGAGNIGPECMITGAGIAPGTIITANISGTGGTGTYAISKSQTVASTEVWMRMPYPALTEYATIATVKDPDKPVLSAGQERNVAITGLPANGTNKKYFLRSRLVQENQGFVYRGPWSEINEVDLEVPNLFWDPSVVGSFFDLTDTDFVDLAQGNTVYYDAETGYWRNNAQLTVDAQNGRVGIGTAEPEVELDIKGNQDDYPRITLGRTGVEQPDFGIMSFFMDTPSIEEVNLSVRVDEPTQSYLASRIQFKINDSIGDDTHGATIFGQLGVNMAPNTALDVTQYGTVGSRLLAGGVVGAFDYDYRVAQTIVDFDSGKVSWCFDYHTSRDNTAATPRFEMDDYAQWFNNTNLGIGTPTPAHDLQIYDNDVVDFALTNQFHNMKLTNLAEGRLSLSYNENRLEFNLEDQWFNKGRLGVNVETPEHTIDAAQTGIASLRLTADTKEIVVKADSANNKVALDMDGDSRLEFQGNKQWFNIGLLGVNRNDPSYILDVNGTGRFVNDLQVEHITKLGWRSEYDVPGYGSNYQITVNPDTGNIYIAANGVSTDLLPELPNTTNNFWLSYGHVILRSNDIELGVRVAVPSAEEDTYKIPVKYIGTANYNGTGRLRINQLDTLPSGIELPTEYQYSSTLVHNNFLSGSTGKPALEVSPEAAANIGAELNGYVYTNGKYVHTGNLFAISSWSDFMVGDDFYNTYYNGKPKTLWVRNDSEYSSNGMGYVGINMPGSTLSEAPDFNTEPYFYPQNHLDVRGTGRFEELKVVSDDNEKAVIVQSLTHDGADYVHMAINKPKTSFETFDTDPDYVLDVYGPTRLNGSLAITGNLNVGTLTAATVNTTNYNTTNVSASGTIILQNNYSTSTSYVKHFTTAQDKIIDINAVAQETAKIIFSCRIYDSRLTPAPSQYGEPSDGNIAFEVMATTLDTNSYNWTVSNYSKIISNDLYDLNPNIDIEVYMSYIGTGNFVQVIAILLNNDGNQYVSAVAKVEKLYVNVFAA